MNGTIREANLAAAALLHAPQEFLVGKPLVLFVAEEERKEFRGLLLRLRRGEKIERWEAYLQPRPGALFPAGLRVNFIRDAKGSPIGLRWLVLDITEHKRGNEALRESN
ncbi:MAG: PAS domain S-box protein, partial [Deltaproteobacteria bacterium]|nr:PAS domain S-box protein [Deltaproteobacteria bacterium]